MKAYVAVVMGVAVLGLCQCDGKKNPGITMYEETKTYPALDAAMAYDVHLEVTPQAVKALQAAGETIAVNSAYYGLPTLASMPRVNSRHQVELGSETVSGTATATHVTMTGALDRSQLKDIVDGTPYMFVSANGVTKVGLSSDTISCTYYRGSIAQAQVAGAAVLHCDVAKGPD